MSLLIEQVDFFEEPYHHFVINKVFNEDHYEKMIKNLPPLYAYRRYNDIYKNRYLYDMKDPFWSQISDEFHRVYGDNIRVQMCRDLPGYKIGPHTDGKRETMTILFYLTDKELDCGTSVYRPLQDGFTSDGRKHLDFDGFIEVKRVPFKPNTGFGFKRADNSFHGVKPTEHERNLIQVSVWA